MDQTFLKKNDLNLSIPDSLLLVIPNIVSLICSMDTSPTRMVAWSLLIFLLITSQTPLKSLLSFSSLNMTSKWFTNSSLMQEGLTKIESSLLSIVVILFLFVLPLTHKLLVFWTPSFNHWILDFCLASNSSICCLAPKYLDLLLF